MSDGLSLELRADIKDFVRDLLTAEKATESFGRKAGNNISNATPALNSLGQVARDLPFGFIAIQNNLPIVFDQFGALVKQSGGLGNAFLALGKSLIGPAGFTFAIGAVIAGITSLVQKYGSLSNAYTVLTSSNKEATISLIEYNKEIAKGDASVKTQAFTLNTLVNNLSNATLGVQAQTAAYDQLKKLQPDITAGIERENALTKTNIELIKQRTNNYIDYLQLQSKQTAIQSVTQKNEEEIIKLTQDRLKIEKDIINAEAEKQAILSQPKSNFRDQSVLAAGLNIVALQGNVDKLKIKIKNLDKVNQQYYEGLKTVIEGISAYNSGVAITNDKLKEQAKNQKNVNAEIKKAAEDYKRAREEMLKNRPQDAMLDFTSLFKLDPEEAKKRIRELVQSVQQTGFEEAAKTQGTVKGGIQIYPSEQAQKDISNLNLVFTQAQAYFKVLSPIIDNVFSAIENGQNAFRALGQSIKQLVIDIVKALIKTAALAALISIFSQGTISFGNAFNIVNSAQGGILGGIGRSAAPSIGSGGNLQGGMQLGGQVVFVQRGYDLVGVLNAANGSIRNIG